MFGVPPHKIGDLEKATFSNIEHQALEFVTDAILPRVTMWEQAIQRDLLRGDTTRYAKFNLAALLRGDAKSRAEALAIWRRNGIISGNEWRALEEMNPIEGDGGDTYIVEKNMIPLDQLAAVVAAAARAAAAPTEGSIEDLRARLDQLEIERARAA
jgi:phage portal protein BeeE